jgi:hypothetical protein
MRVRLLVMARGRHTRGSRTSATGVDMKMQATVVLSFQAKTLTEAGAILDDVMMRARQREDVDVGGVELTTPPSDRLVTLPSLPVSGGLAPRVPSSRIVANGS